MTNNLIEAQYDITKKSKLKKFYESTKILIYLALMKQQQKKLNN